VLAGHYGEDGPVAVVARASQPDELILRGTLSTIAGQVRDAGVRRSAVIIVGPALGDPGFCDSHLYSTARERTGGAGETRPRGRS
jgi:precorrin-4/cobalt-precorrin-4 C11-methyltransferase